MATGAVVDECKAVQIPGVLGGEADGSFGDFTFGYYRDLLTSPRFFSHFVNSGIFAAGSGLVAIAVLSGQRSFRAAAPFEMAPGPVSP